jgi:hypothetical protein
MSSNRDQQGVLQADVTKNLKKKKKKNRFVWNE